MNGKLWMWKLSGCLVVLVILVVTSAPLVEASQTPPPHPALHPKAAGAQNPAAMFTMPYLMYPSFQVPEPPPVSTAFPGEQSFHTPLALAGPFALPHATPFTPTIPEAPADPRYVPVPPPDPENPPAEGTQGAQEEWPLIPLAPDAVLAPAADCTAETDMSISKSINWQVNGGIPRPGYEIEYRIEYRNQGNAAARDVRITDTLPLSVTYVSDVPGKGFTTVITTGGQVVWTRPFMNPGESGVHILRVRVDETAPAGGSLVNVVHVSTSDPDVNPANDVFTNTATIQLPNLRVTKALHWNSGVPAPGSIIIYRLRFANESDVPAQNVFLTDTLPVSVTYLYWSSDASAPNHDLLGRVITESVDGNRIVWPLGEVGSWASGFIYLTVRVDDDPAIVGNILTNTLTIATTDTEVDTADNTASDIRTVQAGTWDVRVSKWLYSGVPTPGNTIVYQIEVQNGGSAAARDVVLTDTLPPTLTFVSWSSSSWSESHLLFGREITAITSPHQVIWPLGDVWGSGNIFLTARIAETATVGSVLTNTAVITTSNPDSNPANNMTFFPTAVAAPTRDVRITKSLDGSAPAPGGWLRYQLYFRNDGNSVAHDVVITDTLPEGVTYVSWYGYSYNPGYVDLNATIALQQVDGQLIWPLGTLQPGGYGYIYLTAHVTDAAPVGSILTNTAAITTSDLDSNPANDTALLTTAVVAPTQDVRVTKSLASSSAPPPGGWLQYRLYFSNNGNSTAHDVVITDTLPEGVTYVSWYGDGHNPDYVDLDAIIALQQVDGQLIWPLGTLQPGGYGNIYITARVADTAPVGSVLTNTAAITTSDPDSNPANNTALLTTAVVAPTQDVRVTKSLDSSTPVPGGRLRYRLYFVNDGNSVAHDVVITDTLPEGVTYVSWYGDGYNPGHVDIDATIELQRTDGQLIWPLGTLRPGGYGYIYVTVRITDTAPVRAVLCNLAHITTSDPETNLANNVYTHTGTVHAPLVDLTVAKSLNGQPGAPGGRMQYRIEVSNRGNVPAADVILTDTLPSGVTLVSWSGGANTITEVDGKLVWQLGELPASSNRYIYLTVRIAEAVEVGTWLTNTVEVWTSSPDVDWRDNSAVFGVAVAPPTRDMYLWKWKSSGAAVPGEELTYGVSIQNQGNMPATNVILTDTLPGKVSYVSWSGYIYNPNRPVPAPVVVGNQMIWRLDEMEAGQYGYFYITVRVAEDASPGETLVNRARTTCDEPDVDPADNETQHSLNVVAPTRDVVVSKERSGVPGAPGGLLRYRIDFRNVGNARARDVVITETLPPTLTYVSWSGLIDDPYYGTLEHLISPTVGAGQIVWPIGELLAGQSGYILLVTRVAGAAQPGDRLTNVVQISTSSAETGGGPNVFIHTETVTRTWDVAVSKSLASNTPPLPGSEVEYVIYVSNEGNSTVSNVVVTDAWPVSVTYLSWSGYLYNPHRIDLCDEDVTLDVAGRQARWELGALQPGAYGRISLRMRIAPDVNVGEILVNQATVSAAEVESNMANNVSRHNMKIVAPEPDLYISKSLEAAGMPGEQMRYRLYFGNQGNSPAADVVITDTLPPGVTFESWFGYMYAPNYVNLGQTISPVYGPGQVVWRLGTLPRSAWGYIWIVVRLANTARVGAPLLNRAEIATADAETDYTDNVSTNSYTVGNLTRALFTYKYLDSTPGAAGGMMRYWIYIGNDGNYTVTNVILTDTLPLSVSLASWDGYLCWREAPGWSNCRTLAVTPTVDGGRVVWRLGDLAADGWGYLEVNVRVDEMAAVRQVLKNVAEVMADGGTGGFDDEYTRVTLPWTDLSVGKYLSSGPAVPGGEMTYQLYLRNYGNITATNVIVTDDLPDGAEYVDWWGYLYNPYVDLDATITPTVAGGQVTWAVGMLQPGQSGYIYLTVRVADTLQVCDRLTNTVTIAGAGPDFDPEDNVARHTTRVAQLVPLTGVTISGPTTGTVGNFYNFTASVTPPTATRPVYTWSSAGLVSGQGTSSARYRWTAPGTYTITVWAENPAGVVSDTHVIVITCIPLTGVAISGPANGLINRAYTFNAVITPTDASRPITYTWSPAPTAGQGTASASYTWPVSGTQTITLRVENCGGVFTATHTIRIVDPCPNPLTGVTISGPVYGYVNTDYTFQAIPQPANATRPITYTWSPAPGSGQGTANASYNWAIPGSKHIEVTAENCGGEFRDSHDIVIGSLETVTATVTPTEGITLVFTDPQGLTTTAEVPAGAVTETIELRFTPVPSPTEPITGELRFANHAFDLDAYRGGVLVPGFVFERPVTITIHYSDVDVAGLDESTLALYYWQWHIGGGAWIDAATTCPADYVRRPDRNWLRLPICHLSRFGVMGYGAHYDIYLPLVMRNWSGG